jgi:metal-responsive CopG/Arc/MetJ family transcriptional regulator
MMAYNERGGNNMARRRITVDLDEQLLTALDAAAAEGNRSRNQFLIDAVERVLRETERRRIDAAFARMAEDAGYQAELRQIEQELSPASDAAWRQLDLAEQRHPGSH